jgi:hypothetical protein
MNLARAEIRLDALSSALIATPPPRFKMVSALKSKRDQCERRNGLVHLTQKRVIAEKAHD